MIRTLLSTNRFAAGINSRQGSKLQLPKGFFRSWADGDPNPPGGGTGGGGGTPPGGTGAPGGTTPPGNGGGGGATSTVVWTPEQQAEINRIMGDVRNSAKEAAKAEIEAEAQRKAQEEAGQFKPLYEQEKAKADRLQKEADRAKELEKTLLASIDTRIKGWPKEITDTDPRKLWGCSDLDIIQKWADGSEALAKKMIAAGQAPNPDTGGGTPPAGGGGTSNGGNGKDPYTAFEASQDYAVPGQEKK